MKHWIEAARLRTLPLSVSGILLGSFYALSQAMFNWKIVLFALTTTLLLQILSNFANDYGDGVKGTDNEQRIGPARALQSGYISPQQMKKGILFTAVLALLSALALIYVAFGQSNWGFTAIYVVLGLAAIAAAIKYTVGKSAYGYRGLGDVFVFVFFGLVSTLGVYFLFAKQLDWIIVFPAIMIGCLSVGVLNLNNLRDAVSDQVSDKQTLVVKNGRKWGVRYHNFLVLVAIICAVAFAVLDHFRMDQYLFVLAFVPLTRHLVRVNSIENPRDFDPELKVLSLSAFALSVLMSLSMISFLEDVFVQIYKVLEGFI